MIKISGGYVPENHNPYNEKSIAEWLERLQVVYDFEKTLEIDNFWNEIKLKNGI